MISQQQNIDKYLNAKDPYKAKYQSLLNKREGTRLKHLNDSKAFIEYANDIDDIYKTIQECNPNKKRKMLIVFDDMIADMLNNKQCNPVVTELFIRDRKLNIFLVFITQSYFAVPKNIRLNSTHYFVMINKRKLRRIVYNHSSDIDFKEFLNLYKKMCSKTIFFFSY